MPKKHFSAVSQRLGEAAAAVRSAEDGALRSANLQAVQAQMNAIARGELQDVLELAHPDVELEIFAPPEFRWLRQARGAEELRAALAQNFGGVEQQRPVVHNVVTQGDTVILLGEETGVIRATGAAYDVQFVQRFTFADGRLRSVRIVAAHTERAGPH